jgi:hypothetical protein
LALTKDEYINATKCSLNWTKFLLEIRLVDIWTLIFPIIFQEFKMKTRIPSFYLIHMLQLRTITLTW